MSKKVTRKGPKSTGAKLAYRPIGLLAGILAGLVSGAVFVVVAPFDWGAALLVAVGATLGGWLGARVGRRLPPAVLRAVVVVVGLAALLALP